MSSDLQSMTGFARMQTQDVWGNLVCELRSVNHRYFETTIHMPDALRVLESSLRDQVRHYVKRGKVECYIRFQHGGHQGPGMSVNTHLLHQLCDACDNISVLLKNPTITNTMDILRWPGVLQVEELDLEIIQDEIIKLLDQALLSLVEVRVREGMELRELFFQRLDAMDDELAKIKQRLPAIMAAQREKLTIRFADVKMEIDPSRLEQEIVMIAQRIDVSEEIDRLSTHITETRRNLKQGGTVGRRLDFLMQELHREANTLGAKSIDVDTTRSSVELKVLIEQMREQTQNIE